MSSPAEPKPRPRIFLGALLIATGLVLLYAIAGYWLLPWYAKRELPRVAEEQFRLRASVGEVSFNPFTLKLRAGDFALTEPDGLPVLGFGEANLDLEWGSIFKRALVVTEVRLTKPALRVGIAKDGKVNLAALAAGGGNAPADAGPPRFDVRHIAIADGSIDFEDLRSGYKGGLSKLSFELSPLTTLDPAPGPYVLLADTPNGGKLRWKGELSLQPLVASGTLELENASLPNFNAYLDEFSTASLVSGRADVTLPYRFAFTEGKPGLTLDGAKIVLREVALAARGVDAPFATVSDIAFEGVAVDTLAQRGSLQAFRVANLALSARRDAKGELDLARIFGGPAPADAAAPSNPKRAGDPVAWNAKLGALELNELSASLGAPVEGAAALQLKGAKFTLLDASVAGRGNDAPGAGLSRLSIDGIDVDTQAHRAMVQALRIADLAIAAKRDAAGEIDLARLFSGPSRAKPAARAAQAAAKPAGNVAPAWHAEIAALEFTNASSQFVDASAKRPLTLRQKGITAKMNLTIDTGAAGVRAKIGAGDITLAELLAGDAAPAAPVVSVSALAFKGLRFDSGANSLDADLFRIGKFGVVAAMEGERLTLLDFLPPAGDKSEKPTTVNLKAVEFADGGVSFTDRSKGLDVALNHIAVKLADVSNSSKKPVTFQVSALVQGGGRLAARGRSSPAAGTVEARVEASDLPLARAQPFLEKYASVKLASGQASFAGDLKAGGANPKLSFAGAAAVNGVAIDSADGVRLAAWKSLATDSLRLSLAPNRVEIDELRLVAPAGRFAIAADGTTNMSRAFARKDGTTQVTAPPNVVAPTAPPASAAPASPDTPASQREKTSAEEGAFSVLVRRTRIEDGQLDFSDDSLKPAFGTRMHALAGTLNGLSSDRTARAQFALDGRVDEFGSAKLSGTLNPFAWRDNTAIAMQFRNIDLQGASTYSIKFAGYRIATGRLHLDLGYRVRDGKLEGDNKMVLEKFTLGEKVESAGALDLPISLAIALLKDADGKIDLVVPITGSVDDPKFGVGALVWQAVKTIIGNIVAAPFRALGRLFGGGASDNAGAIGFDPGSARLSPPALEQVGNIVGALKKRPELKLGIPGRYDSLADAAALRRDALARELAKRSGFKLAADEAPGPVSVDDKQTRSALRTLFVERFAAAEFDKLKAEAEAKEKAAPAAAPAAGEAAKPLSIIDRARNFASGEPQLADPREFYRELLRRLREGQPLPANALPGLAQQRAAAIQAALASGGVEASRLTTSTAPPLARADAKEVSIALTLGVK